MHTFKHLQSLRHRLPLLITGLLCVVVVAFSGLAYSQLTSALVAITGERAIAVSQRLAMTFGESEARLRREGTPLSHLPSLVPALLTADSSARAVAQGALDSERQRDGRTIVIELFNRRGERLLVSGMPGAHLALLSRHAPAASLFASPSLTGPLLAWGDTVFIAARVPVIRATHDTVGYLRTYRRMSSDQPHTLVRSLIGSDMILLLGNADGSIWTDLTHRVDGPHDVGAPGIATETTGVDGRRWVGALTAVPDRPLQVWVALPRHLAAPQSREFLVRTGIIAVALLALGMLAARMLSMHIVAPLLAVTRAAKDIAAGDISRRVAVTGTDEIGQLATAFNAMASEMETATTSLEQQQLQLELQRAQLETANFELQDTLAMATESANAADRARARSAAVLAASLDCIITTDHLGNVLEFNPAAEHTFGYSAAETVGKPLHELILPPSDHAVHQHGLVHTKSLGGSPAVGARVEMSAVRADGGAFPIECAITAVPVDGPPLYTAFIRDLSQRKALEAQLQQSQKMEAVGRLAGGVAHDFNNILTVILSYTDVLLADYEGNGSLRTDIEHVRSAAERAAALTRQLLAFSRKQVMHPTVLDINGVVGALHSMLARVIRENVRLETKLADDIWAVCVDRSQLEQVLMNLAVNARDAMPDGGLLLIETANVELDQAYVDQHPGATPGRHVALSVSDTGVGMDAATRDRVFEPFFTTKGPGKGTGLGLSTVYGIVKQSGGSIWVYSEPGRGTSFKVYFPRYEGTVEETVSTVKEPIVAQRDAVVLLVEDDAAVRAATRRLLERFGYSVVEASDAETALAVVRADEVKVDMVLTDAVMPGMSGLQLAEHLAAERPSLPLVLVSGYTEDVIHREGPLAANAVFLEKPFTVHALSCTIADVLSRPPRREA